jgi:2-amino-4-hydroxy-6-hydroxymethyldihydropteridine diphosphokinase
MMNEIVVVGLGSNLGARAGLLRAALRRLAETPGVEPLSVSPVIISTAVGPPQPDYLNAAVAVCARMTPEALLARCLAIEDALGRVRAERWGPRTIDLDLLVWTGPPVATSALELPHPRLRDRLFALEPAVQALRGVEALAAAEGERLGVAAPTLARVAALRADLEAARAERLAAGERTPRVAARDALDRELGRLRAQGAGRPA